MYYVYLLKSQTKNITYIGFTRDLKQRIRRHQSGEVNSTRAYKPYKLVYYEAYLSPRDARKREIELKKKGQQKELLFKRIENSFNI